MALPRWIRCCALFALPLLGCLGADGNKQLGAIHSAGVDGQGVDGQGVDGQGVDGQGVDGQGVDMSGNPFDSRQMYTHAQKYAGATLNGDPVCLWIEEGQLLATKGSCPDQKGTPTGDVYEGEKLTGLEVYADEFLADGTVGMTNFKYRVVSVSPEYKPLPPSYPAPYYAGTTFLYGLEFENKDGKWITACKQDADGLSVAIPTKGTWNSQGDKLASSTYFTFGCTSGVIAKCYRWGYMPWKGTAFWNQHWACTRLARADYCGNGYSWTKTGTTVNHWDYQSPAPVQEWEPDPAYNEESGFQFEAGWDTTGARCLAHYRWYNLPEGFPSDLCEDQIRGPKYEPPPGGCDKQDPRDCKPTICDDEKEAVLTWPEILQVNKSLCNGSEGTCVAP